MNAVISRFFERKPIYEYSFNSTIFGQIFNLLFPLLLIFIFFLFLHSSYAIVFPKCALYVNVYFFSIFRFLSFLAFHSLCSATLLIPVRTKSSPFHANRSPYLFFFGNIQMSFSLYLYYTFIRSLIWKLGGHVEDSHMSTQFHFK